MTNIIICGIGGKMGKVLVNLSQKYPVTIVGGIDKFADCNQFNFPIFKDFSQCDIICDAVIDFSRPEAIDDILSFAKRTRCGLILATTGYSDADRQKIADTAKDVAIFQTFNFSLGINLIADLCKQAAELLGENYDIEIIEKHHNQKVDAPSGTAILLGERITGGKNDDFVFGRNGKDAKRKQGEIGFSAVRGGNIVGEHEVMFIGGNEIVTISHSAQSKEVFAEGALRAAMFLKGKPAGKYEMKDLIEGQ